MNILIMLNSVVYNRGSEALVRGLSKMLKNKYSDSIITLASSEENFGDWVNIENIDKYERKSNIKKHSLKNYYTYILRKIPFTKKFGSKLKYSNVLNLIKGQDYIFVVGADNYDISYGGQERLLELNTLIRENTNAKVILYDCSLAKRDITDTIKQDFKNFDCVTVRETISEENVESVLEDVICVPDPAFVMDSEKVELPKIFERNKKVIGVNVSNLITNNKYGSKAEDILGSYKNMMNYILESTQYSILLIPHVMNGADLQTLKVLYNDYINNDRVELIENESYNAKQLKYIISNLYAFVGARTHATIAAYSTLVPTLVLGYSIKSKGIAKDLFGTYENYVLPVEELANDKAKLKNSFIWLLDNEESIRKKLKNIVPSYIENANSAIDKIKEKCG